MSDAVLLAGWAIFFIVLTLQAAIGRWPEVARVWAWGCGMPLVIATVAYLW
jgi:hypothetical protein